jgi:hypothetical protein
MCYRNLIALLALIASCQAFAGIPSTPSMSGTDRFEMGSNGSIQCEQAVANSTSLQVGAYGGDGNSSDSSNYDHYNDYDRDQSEAGVYIAITVPLGKPRERVDCSNFVRRANEQQTRDAELAELKHAVDMAALNAELIRIEQSTNSF